MRHIEQLLLAAGCWWRIAHCAVAAPAAPAAIAAPRIKDYTFYGPGCPPDSEIYLSAEPGKLLVEMPRFSVVVSDADRSMINCNLSLDMNGALAGYKLVVKSMSLEGYLFSSGQIDTEMWARFNWAGKPEQPSIPDQPLKQAIESDKAKLQLSRQTVPVPLEFGSDCFSVDGQEIDLMTIGWRLRLSQAAENSYGAFVGMDGSPVLGTVEFEWAPCDSPSVEIEIS